MTQFELKLRPRRDDMSSVTMGFASDLESAIEIGEDLYATVETYGHLPAEWDLAWPVPAAAIRKHKRSWEFRADCFEGETKNGYDNGYCRLVIVEAP